MFPPAPTLFSTTNCCARRSPIFAPMTRATVSVGPPAENDTMMRTGLDGYLSSASAAAATSADAMTARAASNRSRLRITSLLPGIFAHVSTACRFAQWGKPAPAARRHRGKRHVRGFLDQEAVAVDPRAGLH